MQMQSPAEAKASLERHKEAIEQQARFQNLKNLDERQTWLHNRALLLADQFEGLATDEAWVAFWTRENVIKAMDGGDMQLMCHWLRLAIKKAAGEF